MSSKESQPNTEPTTTANQFRRRLVWAMTPEERLSAAERLQADAMKLLLASPAGYEAFL